MACGSGECSEIFDRIEVQIPTGRWSRSLAEYKGAAAHVINTPCFVPWPNGNVGKKFVKIARRKGSTNASWLHAILQEIKALRAVQVPECTRAS